MRQSLYWDDFNERVSETVTAIKQGREPDIKRVSVFVTESCNLKCAYCNHPRTASTMSEDLFADIVHRFGDTAIIHITGGEPSVVPWLYPFLEEYGQRVRFHLNTNAVKMPPAHSVRRLKVSLDSCDSEYFNSLVGASVFDKVVENIKLAIPLTTVSITYTMTHENIRSIPAFIEFANREFPGVYALFFSVYKGDNPRFVFTAEDATEFFENIKPQMDMMLDPESKALLDETITEKMRVIQGIRFPENSDGKCYLSLSEKVFNANGSESSCSHLFRDGILGTRGIKYKQCLYGCNRRLVAFNETVEGLLK